MSIMDVRVQVPPRAPRRSKLCIACSDLFYKSERTHAAASPFQTANASLVCGLMKRGPRSGYVFFISTKQAVFLFGEVCYANLSCGGIEKQGETGDAPPAAEEARRAGPMVSHSGAVCKKRSKSCFPCKMQASLLYYKSVSAGLRPRFWEI